MTLEIPANESGVVRVFSLSMDAEQARALKDNASSNGGSSLQELALGAVALDPAHVEVFPLSDLGEMTLSEYLIEGGGVEPRRIEADRFRLSALDGWIMVVYSGAFRGAAQTLTPAKHLTLVGTYAQETMDWTDTVDLRTPSALPHQSQDDVAPAPRKRPSDAAMSGRIAVLALAVAFFVVALMLWVGS